MYTRGEMHEDESGDVPVEDIICGDGARLFAGVAVRFVSRVGPKKEPGQ